MLQSEKEVGCCPEVRAEVRMIGILDTLCSNFPRYADNECACVNTCTNTLD